MFGKSGNGPRVRSRNKKKTRHYFIHQLGKINFMLIFHLVNLKRSAFVDGRTFQAFYKRHSECPVVYMWDREWEGRGVWTLGMGWRFSYTHLFMLYVSDGMEKVYIIKSSVNKLRRNSSNSSSSRINVNIFERGTINTWFCFGFNTVEDMRVCQWTTQRTHRHTMHSSTRRVTVSVAIPC